MRRSHRRLGLLLAVLASAGLAIGAAEAAEKKAKDDPAQLGRGAKAWVEHCARCHNLRSPGDFADNEWDVIVNHMRVRANLPGDMARDIKAFLKGSN